MEIQVMDQFTFSQYTAVGKNDQLTISPQSGIANDPLQDLRVRTHYAFNNINKISDATYEEMYDKITAAADLNEAKSLAKEAYMYDLKQHWDVYSFSNQSYQLWQPYLKGFSGQCDTPIWWSRVWVDQTEE